MKWRPAHPPHRRGLFKRLAVLLIGCGVAAVWVAHSLNGRASAGPAVRTKGDSARYSPAERAAGMDRVVTHLHVTGVPVEEVVEDLSRQTGVRVVVRWGELARQGTLRSAPVSVGLDGVPLERALLAAFAENGRQVVVCEDHGALTVCGVQSFIFEPVASADPVVRVYDVRDLLEPFSTEPDSPQPGADGFMPLAGRSLFGNLSGRIGPAPWPDSKREHAGNRLISIIDPWQWADGPVRLDIWGRRLVIVASEGTQWKVGILLGALRRAVRTIGPNDSAEAAAGTGRAVSCPVWPDDPNPDPLAERVVPKLDIPPMPLEKALAEFHRQTGAGIVVRAGNLTSVQLQWTIQAQLHDVTVVDAMDRILLQVRPRPPIFRVRDNLLFISDKFADTWASPTLITRVYDVRPLLPASVPPSLDPDPEPPLLDLIRAIIRQVDEHSTEDRRPDDHIRDRITAWNRALVIRETPENHRQIVRLFETLRQRKEREHP